MWVNVISIRRDSRSPWTCLSVGFLTYEKFSDDMQAPFKFDILMETFEMKITTLSSPLPLDNAIVHRITQFHNIYYKSLVRSAFDENTVWASLNIPLVSNFQLDTTAMANTKCAIDWETLERCCHDDTTDLNPEMTKAEMNSIVLYDEFRWKRAYVLESIHEELTPNSIIFEDNKHIPLHSRYKTLFKCKEEIDLEQPLVLAKFIGYPHTSFRVSKDFPRVYLIPELCTILPIRSRHLIDGLSMPLIMQYVENRMLASDVIQCIPFKCERGTLLTASLDSITMALTTPNAGLEYDYERLETLGDSFLKMYLSVHCFVKHPHQHEGFLTVSRVYFENNEYLRNRSNELGLEGYIHSIPFDRRTWAPPKHESTPKVQMLRFTL
jgi:Ribonuclease III domain